MKKTFIPTEFREKYEKLFEGDYPEFMRCSLIKAPKAIWVNSLKIAPRELVERLSAKGIELKPFGFHENAFEITGIDKPGSLDEFREGLFNLQDKAAMLAAIALAPKEGEKLLDMAAAPGTKTIQLATLANGKVKILAIEKDPLRAKSLFFNVRKFGLSEIVKVVVSNALRLDKENYFDGVLLDAPCSSEGLVRKDRDALKNWSQRLVERKAKLQKKMIVKGFDALKEGGRIVYSTCTLSPEENEEVVKHLLSKRKNAVIEKFEAKGFRLREGIGCRILPQDNDSMAFYFCRIKKNNQSSAVS